MKTKLFTGLLSLFTHSRVAYYKYKDWPNFGNLSEGNILLQDHGDEVFSRILGLRY